jgi:hypothetical protein
MSQSRESATQSAHPRALPILTATTQSHPHRFRGPTMHATPAHTLRALCKPNRETSGALLRRVAGDEPGSPPPPEHAAQRGTAANLRKSRESYTHRRQAIENRPRRGARHHAARSGEERPAAPTETPADRLVPRSGSAPSKSTARTRHFESHPSPPWGRTASRYLTRPSCSSLRAAARSCKAPQNSRDDTSALQRRLTASRELGATA